MPATRAVLVRDNYGKSEVRLLKLRRNPGRHEVYEWTLAIRLAGDFETAHTLGDNSKILPTDTMKNTVYAVAAGTAAETPEAFALELARFFESRNPQVHTVEVDVVERPWGRLAPDGAPHEHAFVAGGEERRLAFARLTRGARPVVEGGLSGLLVMKTARSAFAGYVRDEYTTLPETHDRIFRTIVGARWRWAGIAEHASQFALARQALLDVFSRHDSASVQQTLFAMGEAAIAAAPAIEELRLSLPNRHCIPVRLEPFGLVSKNEIFVVTDEPYGLIEATIARR